MADYLDARIRAILQGTPVEELGTITAKDVRAQLLQEGAIDDAYVKANKKTVNALIARVFEEVSAPLVPAQQATAAEDDVPKEEWEEGSYTNGGGAYSEREGTESQADEYADGDEEEDEDGPSVPPKKPHKKAAKSKRELTDEEYARKLSTEINVRARSSRSGNTTKPKKGTSRTPKRNKKSAERVDNSDGSDADSYERPAKKRKTRRVSEGGGGGRAKGGFGKEFILSEPLSALLEVDRLSRPQVVKHLWVYIKGNNLQNPSNKREIMCDDRLKRVFTTDKIDMFKMNKVLGQHLHEIEEPSWS